MGGGEDKKNSADTGGTPLDGASRVVTGDISRVRSMRILKGSSTFDPKRMLRFIEHGEVPAPVPKTSKKKENASGDSDMTKAYTEELRGDMALLLSAVHSLSVLQPSQAAAR